MAQKLSGMEMMMQSLMRAAGFDPVEIQTAMVQVVNDMRNGLKDLVDTTARIEQNQIIMQREINDIREHLAIPNDAEILPLRLPKRQEN